MSKLETLAYVSKATRELASVEVDGILADARKFNGENQISGVLFYSDGRFFQVIEGSSEAIEAVFERIESAQAHQDIETLLHEEIEDRNFADWHMGFVSPPTSVMQELAQADWHASMPVTRPNLRKSKGLSLASYHWSKWAAEANSTGV